MAQVFTKRSSYRFLIPILAAIASIVAQSGPRPGGDDAKVSIEPRTKPSAKKEIETFTERRQGNIRVDMTLVQINVTVTDPLNRFVTGLEKEHFKLFEDKVEQTGKAKKARGTEHGDSRGDSRGVGHTDEGQDQGSGSDLGVLDRIRRPVHRVRHITVSG